MISIQNGNIYNMLGPDVSVLFTDLTEVVKDMMISVSVRNDECRFTDITVVSVEDSLRYV